MDASGKVVGLLDITKCLYDAIERLEKAADKKEQAEGEGEKTEESAAMLGVVLEAAKTMKGRSAKNHRAIQASRGRMMGDHFGNDSRKLFRICIYCIHPSIRPPIYISL